MNNVLNKMRHVQPEGTVKFLSGVRIAHVRTYVCTYVCMLDGCLTCSLISI